MFIELFLFVILNGFLYRVYAYAMIVHTQTDQLLPQLWVEQFDSLPPLCRHIEHMHEEVCFKTKDFCQNDSYYNLDNVFLNMAFVYAKIVLSWANQLLPQLLVEQFDTWPSQYRHITLNICMKDKMTAMKT